MTFHSGVVSPQGVWWRPAGRQEKLWVMIAFAWCMVLFAMMPFWHLKGGQNPSGIRHRVEPTEYYERVRAFVADYQVGEDNGIPLVAPPAGAEVYMIGKMWQWYPALVLEEGVSYTLHLSSLDVNHGFGLYPANINFQVVPGYDYGLEITPNESGEYRIVCNEFCGIGHHVMLGRILVRPRGTEVADYLPQATAPEEETVR
jgi:cytochrome c oxidase subunit 2